MSVDKSIPVFGTLAERQGFRRGRGAGGGQVIKGRFVLEITAPDLTFNADENQIAEATALLIADTIKTNMMAGKAPDGSPLPGVSAATVRRRESRDRQAGRNGNVSSRYRNKKFRTRAFRTYRRRYSFLGGSSTFSPAKYGNDKIGLESGLLASSALARPEGGKWTVFFAANRGNVDRSGGSAVSRVFSKIPVWGESAWRQPTMQRALSQMAQGLFAKRGANLMDQLGQTFRRLQSVAGAAADASGAGDDSGD